MKKINLYKILRPIVVMFFKIFYHPKIEGKENIPDDGRIILAGNHVHLLDPVLLASATKRQIYFLSKRELFKGPLNVFFVSLGCVPVDREGKGFESIKQATELLHNDECVGIFPEGTRNKTDDIVLPFKLGTIMIAKRGKSDIIPFAVTGKYKLVRNNLKLQVGEKIKINELNARDALGTLENEEIKALIENVLSPNGYNMIVTPKEIDADVEDLAKIIAMGINITLHKSMKESYLSHRDLA